MPQIVIRNLVGERFGALVVESYSERRNTRHYWHCRCDCGNTKEVMQSHLITGDTASCGCKYRQAKTHGASYSYTYKSYRNMLKRCNQPTFVNYHNYGGRGIKVTARWMGVDGFKNFLEDMGERPQGLTLDRKDTNGNYESDNCKWSTMKEQQNNRRNNVRR